MEQKKRAVAYVRVSTAKQELSPEAQKERLRQFAAFSDYDLPEDRIVVDIATCGRMRFEDRELGRKALALLADADVIIFAKLARAFRNAADALTLVPKLIRQKKDVTFLDLGISVATPTGKMVMGMLAVQAEWELDIISERTKECLDEAKRQGKRIGGVPYGSRPTATFVNDRKVNGGVWAIVPEEQTVIERIRSLRVKPDGSKRPYRDIAAQLEVDQVPTLRGGRWSGEVCRRVVMRGEA